MPPRTKAPTLTEFAKQTRKSRGGRTSQLDDHPTAAADVAAFAAMKSAGTANASWPQFSDWLKRTHGIDMRPNSLYTWAQNRGHLNGHK